MQDEQAVRLADGAAAGTPQLLARSWPRDGRRAPEAAAFVVLTWNVLADGLAQNGSFRYVRALIAPEAAFEPRQGAPQLRYAPALARLCGKLYADKPASACRPSQRC